MTNSTKSLKSFSIAGYFLMLVAVLGLVYARGLFSREPITIAVQILAACLMIWARVTFGRRSFHLEANPTQGGLVTVGPYRYIRHPIYASILYFVSAAVLANWSTANFLLLIVLFSGVAVRIYCEEKLVLEVYSDYAEYAKRTKRIIPFIL